MTSSQQVVLNKGMNEVNVILCLYWISLKLF